MLTLACYALALLSKENALIFPFLVLLYHYSFKKRINKGLFFSFVGISALYILLRIFSLKAAPFGALSFNSALQRLPGFFAAIPNYIRLLIFPFNLHMDYGDKLFKFTDPRVLLGFAMTTLLLFYAVRQRNKKPLVFFSILWFFIALLPVSNLYPVAFYMADHYLYFPSLGFFLLLANATLSLRGVSFPSLRDLDTKVSRPKQSQIVIAATVLLIAFYSYLTIRQNNYWKEPIAFFTRTLKFNPESWRVHHDLACAYMDAGKREAALASYKKTLLYKPDLGFKDTYFHLGVDHTDRAEYDKAIAMFKKVIEIDPADGNAHNNLAVVYYYTGQTELAQKHCNKALELGIEVHPNFLSLLR